MCLSPHYRRGCCLDVCSYLRLLEHNGQVIPGSYCLEEFLSSLNYNIGKKDEFIFHNFLKLKNLISILNKNNSFVGKREPQP